MVKGRQACDAVSFDINPSSREIFEDLTRMDATFDLIAAGARIHQAGCMGCIGMGQAPAVGHNSLRTFPRNFPGRSGRKNDAVWLCSPETATNSIIDAWITAAGGRNAAQVSGNIRPVSTGRCSAPD